MIKMKSEINANPKKMYVHLQIIDFCLYEKLWKGKIRERPNKNKSKRIIWYNPQKQECLALSLAFQKVHA